MQRLAAENVVEYLPRRGFYVKRLTLEEMLEVFSVREVVKSVSARVATENATDEEVAELASLFEPLGDKWTEDKKRQYRATDQRFHSRLVELALVHASPGPGAAQTQTHGQRFALPAYDFQEARPVKKWALRYLDDLESRIDEDIESRLFAEWLQFADGRYEGEVFCPKRLRKAPPQTQWPDIHINEAQRDFTSMAIHQLSACSRSLESGTGAVLCVRCNYGSSIIPSLFGAEVFVMPEETNTLPTSLPLSGGKDAIKRLIDKGVPDVNGGLGAKVFDMAGVFLEIKSRYPKIGRHVHLYHPDAQGPMDICEVLWGSSLFLDIMDEPDLVHDFLTLITETYIAFMRKWFEVVPDGGDYSVHWSMVLKGKILLRDDSAMNFSPSMCDEFIKPYDQKLLDEFGGGGLHFCGKGDHYIGSFSSMRGLSCVDMSQPEYNDMEIIFSNTVDKGLNLLQVQRETIEAALARGRRLRGRVYCRESGA